MKKVWILAVAALALGLVAVSSTPARAEPVVGETWVIGNYCTNVDLLFMRMFTEHLSRGGVPAYQAFVTQEGSPCLDIRHHPIKETSVTVEERLWAFTLPDGEELVLWRVEDKGGTVGYTWFDAGPEPGTGI